LTSLAACTSCAIRPTAVCVECRVIDALCAAPYSGA
jgi:hypothetical protein